MKSQERMRELRKKRKETHVQAALEIGMTGRRYRRLEAGKRKPGFDSFRAPADRFGGSLDNPAGRAGRR